MPLTRKPRRVREVILDVGTGQGEFLKTLRQKNPRARVVGIDHEGSAKPTIRKSLGEFAIRTRRPDRIRQVWLNHTDISSVEAFQSFVALAKRLQRGTQIFLTVREQHLQRTKNVLEACGTYGLRVISINPYTPDMLGSEHTLRYYKESQADQNKKPYRILVVKER